MVQLQLCFQLNLMPSGLFSLETIRTRHEVRSF